MRRSIGMLAMAVVLSLGMSARADITFNFQQFGSNTAIGYSDTFTVGTAALTAVAYQGGGVNQSGYNSLTPTWSASSSPTNNQLYAKSSRDQAKLVWG